MLTLGPRLEVAEEFDDRLALLLGTPATGIGAAAGATAGRAAGLVFRLALVAYELLVYIIAKRERSIVSGISGMHYIL